MPTYIQLLTLNQEGREKALRDPEIILHAHEGVSVAGVQVLGQYAVLGEYDFISIVAAPDNESVARFSVAIGARIGAHVVTLPAIPIARLDNTRSPEDGESVAEIALEIPVTGATP